MKFHSPTQESVYLSTTMGGHTFVVGPEPVELPPSLYHSALMAGALTDDLMALPPHLRGLLLDARDAQREALAGAGE